MHARFGLVMFTLRIHVMLSSSLPCRQQNLDEVDHLVVLGHGQERWLKEEQLRWRHNASQ